MLSDLYLAIPMILKPKNRKKLFSDYFQKCEIQTQITLRTWDRARDGIKVKAQKGWIQDWMAERSKALD